VEKLNEAPGPGEYNPDLGDGSLMKKTFNITLSSVPKVSSITRPITPKEV
jgi:hypothetical protein